MLTISQLAAYAGVTVRAVRHYHQIGLLPEPERDRSGYRSYDAAAVVRLIRVHTLADAGVPLARVQELLDAGPEEFADGVQDIDKDLRARIRRLQGTRKRLARLAAGEHLALPQSVVDYLDRLRGLGVEEQYIEMERDAWIMVAAQVPHLIDSVMAHKHEQLDDPDMLKLYSFLRGPLDCPADDARVIEIADILERLAIRAVEAGEVGADIFDDQFADLLDTIMVESSPGARRILAILEERGWRGWTRIERVPADRLESVSRDSRPRAAAGHGGEHGVTPSGVHLREITDDNHDAVCALRVRQDQERFVASVTRSLADAAAMPGANPWYRAVYSGDEPVGFVMLSRNVPPGSCFLWRLLIDERHQGRGIGREVLTQIADRARSDGATELLTSYEPGDGEPWPFYQRFGFQPTGELDDGEVVLRLEL